MAYQIYFGEKEIGFARTIKEAKEFSKKWVAKNSDRMRKQFQNVWIKKEVGIYLYNDTRYHSLQRPRKRKK